MSDQAARFVGSIPDYYDKHLGPRIFARYAADIAARVAATGPGSVLELAAGTGIVSRCLRDALSPACDLLVSDLNVPMLEVARTKFRAGENVRFEAVDATALPFENASFDAVSCQFGVMFFPDKARSYSEVLRVLRPGGRYIFNVWGSWQQNPFAQIIHETVMSFFPDNPPGFYRVPFGYHQPEVIAAALAKAGFDDVVIEPLQFTSQIPSAEEFARGLVYGNPLIEEIQQRGGDPDQVCSVVATAIDEKLGATMPLAALVVAATKNQSPASE